MEAMEGDMSEGSEGLMLKIYADIQVIKNNQEEDRKTLYGNGHPGLIDRVQKLETEFSKMNEKRKWYREWLGWIFAAITFLASNAKSIIGAFR